METEDVEIHIIAISRRNCFECDLPFVCFHQAVVGPYLRKHLFRNSRDREGVSRDKSCPLFSAANEYNIPTLSPHRSIACTMVLRIFSQFFPPRLSTPSIGSDRNSTMHRRDSCRRGIVSFQVPEVFI